jgi:predicted Zn-dependent peptidase
VVFELPDDWYDTYRERVRAVTTGDVFQAMQTHVHPDELQIVVVGDAEAIRGAIEELEFGPVTVRNAATEPVEQR